MNIFQKIAFVNRISKAVKKSKKLIDSKKDLADKVRKHLDNICGEVQELLRLLNQNKFSPMSQDRLVEVFGYNVGMGESSTVKELLRYISKSNEVNEEEAKKLKEMMEKYR